MKTNLAFALEPVETVDAVGAATLDPAELDRLLRLGTPQAGTRARTRAVRRRVLVSLQDNHSGMFPAFRVR